MYWFFELLTLLHDLPVSENSIFMRLLLPKPHFDPLTTSIAKACACEVSYLTEHNLTFISITRNAFVITAFHLSPLFNTCTPFLGIFFQFRLLGTMFKSLTSSQFVTLQLQRLSPK